MKSCDYLIIGKGLAGSLLTWKLLQAGASVIVLGSERIPSASRAAAGLINPVTGQRLVLQAEAGTLLASAMQCYKELTEHFNQTFFHPLPMLRILQSEREVMALQKREQDEAYQPYLGSLIHDDELQAPLGLVTQFHTGYLDTNALLDALHTYFREKRLLIQAEFDHDDLQTNAKGVVWEGIQARQVVFCEGWRAMHNPWFSYLPFQPAKGEILTLHSKDELPEMILNKGRWLIPLGNGRCRVGASYDRDHLNEDATSESALELQTIPAQLLKHAPHCLLEQHRAGVRPNTLDKQPFIGLHPEHPQYAIFNGFGSKGSMMIPFYADIMCRHLQKQDPLPAEADIRRYACA